MPEEKNKNKAKLRPSQIAIIVIIAVIIVLLSYLVAHTKKININKGVENINHDKMGEEVVNMKDANKQAVSNALQAVVETARPIDDTDHILGKLDAPVQLIVYNDFENQFCADFYSIIEEVKDYFGDKVVIALRHFPLRFNLSRIFCNFK